LLEDTFYKGIIDLELTKLFLNLTIKAIMITGMVEEKM